MDLKKGCVNCFVLALITCIGTGIYLMEARKLQTERGRVCSSRVLNSVLPH